MNPTQNGNSDTGLPTQPFVDLATPTSVPVVNSGVVAGSDMQYASNNIASDSQPIVAPVQTPSIDYAESPVMPEVAQTPLQQIEPVIATEPNPTMQSDTQGEAVIAGATIAAASSAMQGPAVGVAEGSEGELSLKPKKRSRLRLVLLGVILFIVVLGGGLLYLYRANITSRTSLIDFSEATSALNITSSSFNQKVAQVSSNKSSKEELAKAMEQYDGALGKFEESIKSIKSDKKELKEAASTYLQKLKDYRSNEVLLAFDMAGLNSYTKDISVGGNGATEDPATQTNRLSGLFSNILERVKNENLSHEKAKEYRDIYVEFLDDSVFFLSKLSAAYTQNNLTLANSLSAEYLDLESARKLTESDKEIADILAPDAESITETNKAKDRLNDEIIRINSDS